MQKGSGGEERGGEGEEEKRERQQHSSRLRSAGRQEHILRESVIDSTSYLRG